MLDEKSATMEAESKARIVGELGEVALLLPPLVNEALAANGRAKYFISLLQTAQAHADHPEMPVVNLHEERLASGVGEADLDSVAGDSRREDGETYRIPSSARIRDLLAANIRQMLLPLRARGEAEGDAGASWQKYEERLVCLVADSPGAAEDRMAPNDIDRIVGIADDRRDTFHSLVLQLHKELNRLQQQIATESIEGACAYSIRPEDRSLVAAFMSGINQTRHLKFNHPGLGTTATRSHDSLVIENDIGTTDAHVLVIHIDDDRVTVTHTDIHLPRLLFFQSLLEPFAVEWQDTRSRRAAGMGQKLYHLCVGTFPVRNRVETERFLQHLGSRLVFLIDWNRARKRLRRLAPKRVCLEVLTWAAQTNIGHRGFLELGGERLVFDALQFVARGPFQIGRPLSDILGPARTAEFLKFTLKTASEGLLAGRSEPLIRDEISAELRHYVNTVHQDVLEIAAEHASLIVELALLLCDATTIGQSADRDFLKRTAARAKGWEHRADELVTKARTARLHWDRQTAIPRLLEIADDAADALEEALFFAAVIPREGSAAPLFVPLSELSSLLLQGAQEYLKAVENARQLDRESARSCIEDFLQSVDGAIAIEHRTDEAYRDAQASIPTFAGDFRQLYMFAAIARNLEAAADNLMRSALILRDFVLGEVLVR